ncbi:MAG: hypothetical protein ACREPB_03260 [Arenimonas sp.]
MKSFIAATFLFALPLIAAASSGGVRFDTQITAQGKSITSPSVRVEFGHQAVIEIPNEVRVVVVAAASKTDISPVTANFYYFKDGAWVFDRKMEMNANLSLTPSFELDLADGVHRVVVMPRQASMQ